MSLPSRFFPAAVGLAFAGVVLVRPAGLGQGPPAPPERPPAAVHLVGHEDAALLARVQAVIDDWDPRRLQNPYLKSVPIDAAGSERLVVRRPDLLEFIADPEAAVALGKAFFWDMQAGSDFGHRTAGGKLVSSGTACASCHYRNGVDARGRHTTRIPYVAWDKYKLDKDHPAKDPANAGEPNYAEGEFKQWPYTPNADPAGEDKAKGVALIVGSQGVEPRKFAKLNGDPPSPPVAWESEVGTKRKLDMYVGHPDEKDNYLPEWSMFLLGHAKDGRLLRQITNRNSPTTANAVFSDRLFHDGRAESTFNGFSIFGDHDRRQVLFKRDAAGRVVPVHVAISQAALASQSVGPIVNEVEMSYLGRTFPDLAEKLLPRKWLEHQAVAADDSVLSARALYTDAAKTKRVSYDQLIRKAFRPEWWADPADPAARKKVPLALRAGCAEDDGGRFGTLMQANFSLYWGLSIMLYESTLISNQSPFDEMLRGRGAAVEARWADDYKAILAPVSAEIGPRKVDAANPNGKREKLELKTGTAVFQLGFRTFLNRGCAECHSGPLFSEVFDRAAAAEPAPKAPIAFRIERTLLPNAQADAIAVKMQAFRTETEAGVVAILTALGVPEHARPAWVRSLGRLLESAGGDYDKLVRLVNDALSGGVPVTPAKPEYKAIAKLLMTYEKTVGTKVGARTYFPENERVAAAENLGGDVLVEKMLIPASQRLRPDPNPRPIVRPRLPIAGPLAGEAYAFYDGGFYDLGVSPPRFDRGNGVWSGLDDDEDDAGGPMPAADPKAAVKGSARQAAAARGSAYQFRSEWKKPTTGQKQPRPASCDPDTDPAVTTNPGDLSWSRNVVPPDSGVPDLEFDQRRSGLHFFSRARRLVFDEEPTGHRKPFLHDNELAFWGSFKTPTLRNVELTAPYMHNGRLYELADVINFYDAGGRLWQTPATNPDKHPAMVPLDMTPDEKKALRFFLACLTDSRLRRDQAPFDHPSLVVIDGYEATGSSIGPERPVEIAPTGRAGLTALPPLPTFPPQ